MSDEYKKYLEGAYDVNIDAKNIRQVYEQRNADLIQAAYMSAMVKVKQEEAKTEEARRVLHKEKDEEITDEEINNVFENYGLDGRFAEYLVDGAVLTCNQATMKKFEMDGEPPIPLEKSEKETSEQFDDRIHTVLRVSENPISANGRVYATVRDTVKDGNIIPFRCHCKIKADREIEREWIKKDPDCSKHGVCRHLMRLNTEWENYPMDNPYLSFNEIDRQEPVSDSYLQAVRYGAIEDANLVSEKAGITMTSILFCKHGGIITAIESGQTTFSGGGPGKFVGYLAYGGKTITQNPKEGYYMLYDGPTVTGIGDSYMFADIYKEHSSDDGYGALQGYGGGKSKLNTNGEHTTYGGATELDKDKGTLFYNGIERHTVAIGPSLQNPEFDKATEEIDAKDMAYGTCLDVTIELDGETYYIPAVITDVKAHTRVKHPDTGKDDIENSGYYQTNIAFNGVKDGDGKGKNIVEWYVRQGEDSKNKSTGLDAFDSNGGIIIYRDEVMD